MQPTPRFQAEYSIRQNIAEIDAYADVFRRRVIASFTTLHDDAVEAMDREMERLSGSAFITDPDEAAERAFAAGADYYVAVSSVRQGILNLMVAGLYHLLEQQAAYSLETALPQLARSPNSEYALPRLEETLRSQGLELKRLRSWPKIEELGRIANTVKHGDGRSADKLRSSHPELFRVLNEDAIFPHLRLDVPIRPLVGDGLILTAEHFEKYTAVVKDFWTDLIEALLPVMRPDLARPQDNQRPDQAV